MCYAGCREKKKEVVVVCVSCRKRRRRRRRRWCIERGDRDKHNRWMIVEEKETNAVDRCSRRIKRNIIVAGAIVAV